MIITKSIEEIRIMREGGRRLAKVFKEAKKMVKPGITTLELDQIIDLLIKKEGGEPSFKMVPNYHYASCLCVNDCVVHGMPTQYQLKDGDILGIDIGMFYQGYHTDMAETVEVRSRKSEAGNNKIKRFLEIGKETLKRAIKAAIVGNHVGDISGAIQETIKKAGYSVVKQLVGHGIGRKLHEDPQIPGFIDQEIEKTPLLINGVTLAIEIIYNFGTEKIIYKNDDGWTIVTRDRRLSGLFEETIAILKNKTIILTK